jgi:hypothetical protein
MDRVETLSLRLRDQLQQGASVDDLLITVQMLQSELIHLKTTQPAESSRSAISIDIPVAFDQPVGSTETTTAAEPAIPAAEAKEEKIVAVLQIDEAEVEAELEEIKRNLEARNKIGSQSKPPLLFDPVEDTPTLLHQQQVQRPSREINDEIQTDTGSLNDTLRQARLELSDTLKEQPIKDLKKAIGINDRFLFINELFRGDEVMYERSIKTINGFAIFPEAEYWIKRELKLKLGWDDQSAVVKQFDQLIRRRFS